MSSALHQVPVTSIGDSNGHGDQRGESQNLAVPGSNTRGGSNVLGPEPTNSSSGFPRNTLLEVLQQGHSSATIQLESERQFRTETTSGAPSPSGSSENDPWIGKLLLTLGKSFSTERAQALGQMAETMPRRRWHKRILQPFDPSSSHARDRQAGARVP